MSKLENIILDCVNKALDGKQEKLGDYIDPTKQQVKDLFVETVDNLIGDISGDISYSDLMDEIEKL